MRYIFDIYDKFFFFNGLDILELILCKFVCVFCFYESVGVICDSYLVEKWIGVEILVLFCVLY